MLIIYSHFRCHIYTICLLGVLLPSVIVTALINNFGGDQFNVSRRNLSIEKCRVIKLPRGNNGVPRLGKSKNGVYCALLHRRCICEVWFLDESHGHMVWVLKNQINLQPANTKCPVVVDGPWILQSYDEMERLLKTDVNLNIIDDNTEAPVKDDFEWNSENENVVSTADWPREYCDYDAPFFRCLGFHPYKEIILFHDGSSRLAQQ